MTVTAHPPASAVPIPAIHPYTGPGLTASPGQSRPGGARRRARRGDRRGPDIAPRDIGDPVLLPEPNADLLRVADTFNLLGLDRWVRNL